MKKTLIIFVNPDFDRENLVRRLNIVFKDYINIVGRSFDTYVKGENPPLVLAGESTLSKASRYYPESKIVFISRCNSNLNMEKLIMLPKGTRVLVANEPRSAAMATIDDIINMGITHLDLVPYWPSIENYDTNIDTVVYAGYKEHCPPGHARYIDIGQRDINFSVTASIIQAYDLPIKLLDDVQLDTNHRFVDAAYRINSYYNEAQATKNSFSTIFQLSENLLITTDSNKCISYMNHAAEEYFNLKSVEIIGKPFNVIFSDYPSLLRLDSTGEEVDHEVISLHKNRVQVDMRKIANNPEMNAVFSLIPASITQTRDAQIRRDIKESGFSAKYTFDSIIGESPKLKEVLDLAKYYARSDASVFIAGESGTGKELFAQSIHNLSDRNGFPFVSVNCAALPDSLAESELFGYDDGAFTGAAKGGKPGKFEMAHRGTIFLDEIGDAPQNLQTKLLRVIEEQEVVRIGSERIIPIDVRIICASNKDLKKMVAEGTFREDLYYRINVLPLYVPALREHREDIPAIAESMFDAAGMPDSQLRRFFIGKLTECPWNGNVRELRSAVQLLSTLRNISEARGDNKKDQEYWLGLFEKNFDLNRTDAQKNDTPVDLKMLVLKTISTKSDQGISFGRGALLKDVTLSANGLTEYRLKKFLAEFADEGLITIGSTKQGMRITDKGVSLLKSQ